MKKKFIKIGVLLMTVALILGLVLSGVAAADETENQPSTTATQPTKMVKGKVTSIDPGKTFFVVQSGEQEPVTIKVDSNTKYLTLEIQKGIPKLEELREKVQEKVREKVQKEVQKLPKIVERGLGNKNGKANQQVPPPQTEDEDADEDTPADEDNGDLKDLPNKINSLHRLGEKATFDDIAVGDSVVVRLMPNENLAKEVLIVKVKPQVLSKVHGIITAVTNDSLTIKKADNTEVTLGWDANTRFVLKGIISVEVGQTATAVYNTEALKAKVVEVTITPPAPTTASTTSTST